MLGFWYVHLNLNVQTQNITESVIWTKFEFKQKKRIKKEKENLCLPGGPKVSPCGPTPLRTANPAFSTAPFLCGAARWAPPKNQ
jgi:hypothetical protein